jgi:hypothetical protein
VTDDGAIKATDMEGNNLEDGIRDVRILVQGVEWDMKRDGTLPVYYHRDSNSGANLPSVLEQL